MPVRNEAEAHRKAWDTRGRALQGTGSSATQLRSDYFDKEQWYGERTFKGLSDEEIGHNTIGPLGKPLTREDLADLAGAPPGSEVKIDYALDENPGWNATDLAVTVTFPEGSGECYRVIDTMNKTIYNQDMTVKRGKRGKGLGTNVFAVEVDAAARHGFKTIRTMAVGNRGGVNGYYTWARLGFESEEPVRGPNGPIKMSKLMARPDGPAWWKAHGDGFFGVFDLNPSSISMRVFNEYRRLKSERAA